MRPLIFNILLCTAVFAQQPPAKAPAAKAPATKSAASKSAPAKTTARSTVRPSLMNPKSLNAKAPEVYKVQFTTTAGDFVVEVHRDWAPIGADRFYNLVKNGFYTNASIFRVVPGFVAQFGMNASPAINKVWDNASIPDDKVKESNKRGYLCFAARQTPNSRTTQVFISYKDNGFLDTQGFAPFGQVVEGMETVVDKFYSGYGENGPDQGLINTQGKAYIDKNFPKLTSIKLAKVLPAAAPPAK